MGKIPKPKSYPPSEEKISSLLTGFTPQPRQEFYLTMERAPWAEQRARSARDFFSLRSVRWGTLATVSVLILAGMILSIPTIRTNADRLFQFFLSHDEEQRTIQAMFTPTNEVSALIPESQFPLTLEEAQSVIDFEPKELTSLPAGVHWVGAAIDTNRQALILKYAGGGKTILFTQRKIDTVQEYASIGSTAPVQVVQVHNTPGEFVQGGWVVQGVSTPIPGKGIQTTNLLWDEQATLGTLRWQENGFLFEIVTDSPEGFSLEDILGIAESLR